ncbi:hypothetical protein BGZ51_000055 [Haplosporangium sp. Z 767]|nr:hypothetical protein BGZ50_006464 [Haplosporangium sp. Z 11]KAF9195480.1 hypothetical protein BGZ51_000055 [Haplosporangium sp. Z 767]
MPQPPKIIAPQFDVVNHNVKDTLLIVSSLLVTLVHKNDSCYDPTRDPITLFHSRAVPRITIDAYLNRILQYIPFTNEVLLNMLVYLDRIGGLEEIQLHQGGTLDSSTATTTAAAAAMTSSTTASQSKRQPDICNMGSSFSSSPSSAPSNSDCNPPMTQKRGREEAEQEKAAAMEQQKRQRTDSASSSATIPTSNTVPAASNGFRINSFNIHRLLITCVMVAAKFTSDLFYSNARYAKVGGLSLGELNQLELELLFTTKFELNVKVDEIQRVGNALLQFRDQRMVPAMLQQQQQQQLQMQMQDPIQSQQQQQQQQTQNPTQYHPHVQDAITSPITPNSSIPVSSSAPYPTQSEMTPQSRTHLPSPPEGKYPWVGDETPVTNDGHYCQ